MFQRQVTSLKNNNCFLATVYKSITLFEYVSGEAENFVDEDDEVFVSEKGKH